MRTVAQQRVRWLRLARGWTLDMRTARCFLSLLTPSRIETGQQRIAFEQLVATLTLEQGWPLWSKV
jgi:hypothetical protein